MNVNYLSSNKTYFISNDLNCAFFKALFEENIKEVELTLFEDVFKNLYNNTLNFDDYNSNYLYNALSYFGSSKEKDFINHLKYKIYYDSAKELQEPYVNFIEENMKEFHNYAYFIFHDKLYLKLWNCLADNPNISIDFVKKYSRHLDTNTSLYKNRGLHFDFLKHLLFSNFLEQWNNIRCSLLNHKYTPDSFKNEIKQLLYDIDWQDNTYSLEFLRENFEYINWYKLCENVNIPIQFFDDNQEHIIWRVICSNTSIPVWFFEKYFKCIDWYYLCSNSSIPLSFFRKHLEHVNWQSIWLNTNINVKFIKKHLRSVNWYNLSKNTNIPIKFFKKYKNRLDWIEIAKNPSIPSTFLDKNIDHISFIYVSMNPSLSPEFIEKYQYKLYWQHVSEYLKAPLSFFKKYKKHISWNHFIVNDLNFDKNIKEIINNKIKQYDYPLCELVK